MIEELKDLIKLLIAFALYGGLAPLLGMMMATRRSWQRALFGLLMFMPSLQPGRITFMHRKPHRGQHSHRACLL